MWNQQDRVSIVGVGETDYSKLYRDLDPDRTEYELAIEAMSLAIDDAQIDRHDIDGMIISRIPSYTVLGELTGLRELSYVNTLEAGGRQAGLAVQYGAMAIMAGLANCVALVYGNNGRSVRVKYGGGDESVSSQYDSPYGMTSPGAYMSLMFQRHQSLYGTDNRALYEIASANREAASKTPNAVMKNPIDEDQYFSSRYITEPLRLYDYCLVSDGAACIILMASDRAQSETRHPVKIGSTAAAVELSHSYASRDLFYSTGLRLASDVYGAAGMQPTDINGLFVYENFSPLCLFTLEGLGFCDQGASGPWVMEGGLSPRDGFAYNTNGGHLSQSYMQGWALEVEAVRQVRGECGLRQIPNCEVAQYVALTTLSTSHILTQ